MTQRRTLALTMLLVTGVALLTLGVSSGGAQPRRLKSVAAPMRRVGHPSPLRRGPNTLQGINVQSTNWAGYDATDDVNPLPFTAVTATWTQPAVAVTSSATYAAFWVGLDGDSENNVSTTVEQIGTEATSQYGRVTYDAWYEMYPADEVVIPDLIISPGDLITATVTSDGQGGFTLTITDHTTGQRKSESAFSAGALNYSAEVIAEAPADGLSGNVLPLANFGTVDFSGCSFNSQPLSSFTWNQIAMISGSGSSEAATSALSANGTSFSVSSYPDMVTAPTLMSFAPSSGAAGSSVVLTGSGFSDAMTVDFNGSAAAFTVNSDTQITATVPADATSGPITITTPGGVATSSAPFTVTVPPTITLVKPTLTLKLSGLTSGSLLLGKTVSVSGAVTPITLGSAVTLTVQREQNGKWLAVSSLTRPLTASGSYSATFKPATAATYRMKTTIAATAGHTAATTMWQTFTVK